MSSSGKVKKKSGNGSKSKNKKNVANKRSFANNKLKAAKNKNKNKKGKKSNKNGIRNRNRNKNHKNKNKNNNHDDDETDDAFNKKAEHNNDGDAKSEQKKKVDPYLKLRVTDSKMLIRLLLHKLRNYPQMSDMLGIFGSLLQSSMINFIEDLIIPIGSSEATRTKLRYITKDARLVYLLRQSFIRILYSHQEARGKVENQV
jgi:hypothetical protein